MGAATRSIVRQGEGEEEQRQHRPEDGQVTRAGHHLRVPLLHPVGRALRHGQVHHRAEANKKETISFALSGDQDARPLPGQSTPYWNNFEVWDGSGAQKNDFNVLMGDTIYSDTEVPGYTLNDVALTVKQKWQAYKTNLAMKPWSKARGSAAYYGSWDDHEFVNDFARGEDVFPLGIGDVNIDGEKLYENGVAAFTDYTPVTMSKQTGIYRSVQWGKNLEVFFLDDRSFRSNGSDYQGTVRQPARQRRSGYRPDGAAVDAQRLLRDRAAALEPAASGLRRLDQRP